MYDLWASKDLHHHVFLTQQFTDKRRIKADIVKCVSSGAETGWTDLTALALVSIHLFDKDGREIQVSDPIHVSVPLPSDTRNRMATSVPAWLYQPKTGNGGTQIVFSCFSFYIFSCE